MCEAPPSGQQLSCRARDFPGVDAAPHPPRPCGGRARALSRPGLAVFLIGFPFVRHRSVRRRSAPTMLEGCFIGVSTFGPECRQP